MDTKREIVDTHLTRSQMREKLKNNSKSKSAYVRGHVHRKKDERAIITQHRTVIPEGFEDIFSKANEIIEFCEAKNV